MSFGEYLVVLRRRWRLWAAGALIGILVALVVSVAAPKEYTATATSFVTTTTPDNTDSSIFQGSQFTVQRVKTYASLVKSRVVLATVINQLGLNVTVPQLRTKVSASSPTDTALIQVSATDRSPTQARDIANSVAVALRVTVVRLETPPGSKTSQVSMSLTNPAEIPGGPSFPRTKLNLLLGLVAGLAGGVVAAVLRNQLDTRIKTRHDVREVTGTMPLGVVRANPAVARQPVLQQDGHGAWVESIRTIRTGLKFASIDSGLQHFAITSSVASEGKSVLACNLAASWAMNGLSTCLVEADLRRPSCARYLGLEGGLGLSDVLVGEASLDDALVPWHHGLITFLPAGSLPPDPAALLESGAMHSLVAELKKRFDIVIYDTPPVLAVADALVLGKHVDGVICLARAGSTTREQLALSVDTFDRAQLHLLGTVLTSATPRFGEQTTPEPQPSQIRRAASSDMDGVAVPLKRPRQQSRRPAKPRQGR